MYEFTIRGSRGTTPACGRDHINYGGNTTCFTLKTDTGYIIFDAGTGISSATEELVLKPKLPSITMFLTHFHMDHIIGLPSFAPMYDKKAKILMLADPLRKDDWKASIKTFIGKPYWPIGLGESDAVMNLEDLPVEKGDINLYGVKIKWLRVPHPQGCLAYRITMPGREIVISTDTEFEKDKITPTFIDFCRKADVLIFDAQYTPEEYPAHRGWGHSTWEVATRVAAESKVGRLILTHHGPNRKDNEIDDIANNAQKIFPNTLAAKDNMIV